MAKQYLGARIKEIANRRNMIHVGHYGAVCSFGSIGGAAPGSAPISSPIESSPRGIHFADASFPNSGGAPAIPCGTHKPS